MPTIKTKAAAAIAGLVFSRIEENIWRASVRWFGPATNSVDARLEQAAASLGAAPPTVLARVTWAADGAETRHREETMERLAQGFGTFDAETNAMIRRQAAVAAEFKSIHRSLP